jgi:hypothetical protein
LVQGASHTKQRLRSRVAYLGRRIGKRIAQVLPVEVSLANV